MSSDRSDDMGDDRSHGGEARAQVKLSEQVGVSVFAHALVATTGPVPCWTYVTAGLRAYGQDELVFTMTRGEDTDEPPPEPVELLRAIGLLAAEGRVVGAGDFTELGPSGFLGNPALRGFGYERASAMDGVTLPAACLQMVALFGDEIEIAKAHGVLRVLARIGRAHRFFPTAPWCVPARAPFGPLEPPGILAQVPCARFAGATASLDGAAARVRLRLHRRGHARLAAQLAELPPTAAFALLTSLDPSADSCLVWTPGQTGPEAIAAPGSTGAQLAGCFLLVVPEQAVDGGNPFEDGFAILLTDPSTARLRDALVRGEPLDLPPAGGGANGLAITWYD